MSINTTAYHTILKEAAASNALLVAVSKTKSIADIRALYDLGHRDFGENYVQELADKFQALPNDIRWHFIGHLQTNKVKYIAPFVHLIHSVDSQKLLSAIHNEGKKIARVIPCLLQSYISKDANKYGMDENELQALVEAIKKNAEEFHYVDIRGLMGMASFTEDNGLIIAEFERLHKSFVKIQAGADLPNGPFDILSMGMSADYRFALAAGSNLIRIGSTLFGSRT